MKFSRDTYMVRAGKFYNNLSANTAFSVDLDHPTESFFAFYDAKSGASVTFIDRSHIHKLAF